MYTYGIPDLDFDGAASDHYFFGCKLDAHCRVALRGEGVVDEAVEDGAFTDWGVANEDVLEDVVVVESFLHDYYLYKIW